MIENTFLHIPGIGKKTERLLWKKGILTWKDFLDFKGEIFSPSRDRLIRSCLIEALESRQDICFFKKRMPGSELWRLYDEFRDNAVFLDIETDGGVNGSHNITVIGLYDGHYVKSFVNGKNLHDFEAAVADFDIMITFNGKCFDIPIISRCFRDISLPCVHLDLRFMLGTLGYKGGLKKIEKKFGISRGNNICGLNGYDAVLLWDAYQRGDQSSLKRLIEYNRADIVNMKPLVERGCRELREKVFSNFLKCA